MSEDLKRYWSRYARSVTPYVPGEQLKDRPYIKLNTNENPYGPGPRVREALKQADLDELRLYPDPRSTELRSAIAEYFDLSVAEIFVGNGSDEVLDFAFQAFFDQVSVRAEAILLTDLTYSFYPVFAEGNGIEYKTVAVEEDFTLNPQSLIQDDVQGIIIANPNAPTGRVLSLCELDYLLGELDKRGQFAIIDEAYIDFGGESAVGLLDQHKNFIVIQTFSKSRSLAGLRLGFAIGRKEAILAIETVRDMVNSYNVDTLTQIIGKAAFEDMDYFRRTTQKIVRTREDFIRQARQEGFNVLPSETNFVLLELPGMAGSEVYSRLREAGILVRYLSHPRIERYVRISIGRDEEMAKVLAALKEIKES